MRPSIETRQNDLASHDIPHKPEGIRTGKSKTLIPPVYVGYCYAILFLYKFDAEKKSANRRTIARYALDWRSETCHDTSDQARVVC